MRDMIKSCLLGASLLLILCINGAIAFEYGSKVISGDADEGRVLESFPGGTALAPTIAFLSMGAASIFDENSVVYLDFSGDMQVDVGDLRLTRYGNTYAAGTKVLGIDIDHGAQVLTSFANPAGQIYYGPRFVSPGYALNDSVYLKTSPLPLISTLNDVRLSSPSSPYAAGSKIRNGDIDFNTPLTLMVGATAGVIGLGLGPVADLRFYNLNGDVNAAGAPVYGPEDPVYLDVSFPGSGGYGIVSPNDLRLSS